jgi:retron-type reverse transcriptase
MKKLLLILFTTISIPSIAQDSDSINFSILKKEVQWFIDTVEHGNSAHENFTVYTLYVHDTKKEAKSLSFYITFFYNGYNYDQDATPYMFSLGKDVILLNVPKKIAAKWVGLKLIEKIDLANIVKIQNRLPKGEVFMTHDGDHETLLCWYDGHKIRKRFCEAIRKSPGYNGVHVVNYKTDCNCREFADVKKSFSKNPDGLNINYGHPYWDTDREQIKKGSNRRPF